MSDLRLTRCSGNTDHGRVPAGKQGINNVVTGLRRPQSIEDIIVVIALYFALSDAVHPAPLSSAAIIRKGNVQASCLR